MSGGVPHQDSRLNCSTSLPAATSDRWVVALEQLRGAFTDKTIREYAKSFRLFDCWCWATGREALPASPNCIADYVDAMADRLARGTIVQHIYAIRRVHLSLGLPDPTKDPMVLLARRRCRRGGRHRQALPLTRELVEQLLLACPTTLRGKRDRAMISLGFDTLCRGSELAALRIEDLETGEHGAARIFVRRAKNDQFGYGGWAYLTNDGLGDVQEWLTAAGLDHGPVLRRLFRSRGGRCWPGEREIQARVITLRLRAIAAAASLPPDIIPRLSSHSFRVGGVQRLAREGRSIIEIMRAGRWRSIDALADYLRDAPMNVWAERGG